MADESKDDKGRAEKYYRITHAGVDTFRKGEVVPASRFREGADFGRLREAGAVAETTKAEYDRQQGGGETEADAEKAADEARLAQPRKAVALPEKAPGGDPTPRK